MKSFTEFFLEYHHNLADGTKQIHTPFVGKNGNGPGKGSNPTIDPLSREIPQIVGDYKAKNPLIHKPGRIFIGPHLTDILAEYELEFENGKTKQIKNSPNALQMYINPITKQPAARVVQTKKASN